MEGRRREPFFTADHMAHLHKMVVDNIGEMICRKIVGTLVKHLVIEDAAIDFHFSSDKDR